ncbi:DNA glycosylase/AP lyase ROS1 isoform X1 [Musa acuminata AAA Group]|uniref:DNA glycosylase/AP lyase ROS1 isoform X1 n=2 Tax=Musa acuminata AAA Group TaxID=214697 RepID=UPI0031D9E9F6
MEFNRGVPLQQQQKDFKIPSSWFPATPAKPVPTQRHFVPDNDQQNPKSTASNCLETVQVSTGTCGGGLFQETASQGTAFPSSSSSAGSSHNARPSMMTFNAAGGGWRWNPCSNPMELNDDTTASRNPFFALLLQSQIGEGQETLVHPNQLSLNAMMLRNPSLSNEKIITTGVTDAMPSPLTPETMEKNKFLQECLHQEVTGFVQERVTGGNTLENESEKWQTPVVKKVYPSFLNLTVPSSSEHVVLTSSDLIMPSSSEFALPYQVMPSEQVQNEVRAVVVTEQDAQPLNIEKHNLEIQGVDFNKTPQQKPKRKKHRPKVIKEGKPTRTPKPRTPKLVTPEVAKMKEEGSTGKRKYVRKKIVLSSSDASSSILVDNVVLDGTNRGKSVRRRLNFDSESMGARDACPGAAIAFKHCAPPQTLDSCLHSTMQPDLQSQAMIENPVSGMTIDLSGSIMVLKGRKRDNNVVQDVPIWDYREFIHTIGGFSQLSESHRMSDHDLFLPTRSKKKRTGNNPDGFTSDTSEGESRHVSTWRANHRVVNNTPMALEEQQTLEHILAFDKIEKQRSDVKVQSHELDSVCSIIDAICTTPLKQSDCSHTGIYQVSSPMKPHRGNDCQKDEIFKTENSKDAHVISTSNEIKPKRHTKKEEATVANTQSLSTDQVGLQGQKIASCNFDYSLVQKIPDFRVLIPGDCNENISHTNISYQCQNGSSFHNSVAYNLMSGALEPFGDPLDDIIEKLRHITLDEIHEDTREKAKNAIVPYDGGGVIVPYKGEFELAKKRRPRPKVDLDAETFRVWNLLMGTGGNDSVVENDSEKEKHWEEERNVFHGRVDSFIARMHLVQGDRRFSKWKGSVVDSVVGVFLTQNVSDHLSSSAFMALAARFPSKLSRNNAKPHEEKRRTCTEVQEGCTASLKYSSKLQDHMLSKESCCVNSHVIMGENESSNSNESFGYNTRGDSADCSRKCVDMHEAVVGCKSPNNSLDITVAMMRSKGLTKAEDRWALNDVASLRNYIITSKNPSENQVLTTDQIELNSLSNFQVEDIMTGSMPNCVGSSSSFTKLLQMAEKILPENFQDGICQCTDNVSEKKTSLLDPSCNLGMSTSPAMPYCFNKSSRSELVDMGSATVASHECRLNYSLMINANGDKIFDSTGDSSAVTTAEVIVQQKLAFIPRNKLEDDSASISKCLLQPVTSSEAEACTRKQFFCHSDFQKQEKEASISNSITQTYTHVKNQDTIEIQQRENAKFQTECTGIIQAQMQNFGTQQNIQNFYSKQRNQLEVSDEVKTILEDEACNLQIVSDETTKVELKEKKIKDNTERKGAYDWDILRKNIHQNGTRKERTRDTLDSLDWEAVRCAEVNEISETIRERGMNNKLAARIKDFLNRLVKDHGSIDLEWLKEIEPDQAKDYLLSIRGLGLKSVECVRLLTLQHLAFPVDTNVGRICVRLGWVPLQPLPESLQLHLLELYPMLETIQKYLWPRLCKLDQRTLYELHYQMITFGKVFCTKSKPNCNACPMRAECKHFASAFASARLALPGPEEKNLVISTMPLASEINCTTDLQMLQLPQFEVNRNPKEINCYSSCEPVVEEPSTPEAEEITTEESAIEDIIYENPDEIPEIKLNFEEFTQNLQCYMQGQYLKANGGDISKALMVRNPEAASIPMPKLKNVSRLRTEHHVYELPDSHPLLEGLDQREPDDPSSYLLAIWSPGETAQSTEPPEAFCNSQEMGKLCDRKTCFACNSIREAEAQTVRGTILIPCRTAMRGSFPLNGTYFQVNEVFADHDTSCNPIDVPREWIWNLPRRTVYFGTSVPTIFKGLTTQEIQQCFWRGFVCVRGFDQRTRAPKPLYVRFHFPASKAPRNKKIAAAEARKE